MITKTLSGSPILDESFGGVYSKRSFLVCGASQSGKTIMGLRFTQQGLEQNERCLYLSTMIAGDLSICAQSLGFDLTPAIDSTGLTLLEYESFIHGSGAPGLDMLPPEGFEQLRDIIHANSIERVVLDTVLPWVSVKSPDRMAEQIFSLTRSFDRLGVTTMLTLPKPVSSMSFRLKKSIEDVVPISILLAPENSSSPATFQVVKYLGEKKLESKLAYNIGTGEELSEKEIVQFLSGNQKKTVNQFRFSDKTESPSDSKSKATFRAGFSNIKQNRQPTPPPPAEASEHEEEADAMTETEPDVVPETKPVVRHEQRKVETVQKDIKEEKPDPESSEKLQEDTTEKPKSAARLSSIWKPNTPSDHSNADSANP